jgi:hypothetical protein
MGATFCRADTETECVGNTNRWVWNDMSLGQAYSDPAIQNGGFWIDPNARTLSSKPWENGKALVRINAEVSPGLLWHRRTAEFRAVVDLADYAQSTAEQPKPLELQGTGELAGSTITVTFTPSVAVPPMP